MRRLEDRRRSTSEVNFEPERTSAQTRIELYVASRDSSLQRRFFIADWKRLYQFAILELDPHKLPRRVSEARHAVLDRAEEIMTTKANLAILPVRCVC